MCKNANRNRGNPCFRHLYSFVVVCKRLAEGPEDSLEDSFGVSGIAKKSGQIFRVVKQHFFDC